MISIENIKKGNNYLIYDRISDCVDEIKIIEITDNAIKISYDDKNIRTEWIEKKKFISSKYHFLFFNLVRQALYELEELKKIN